MDIANQPRSGIPEKDALSDVRNDAAPLAFEDGAMAQYRGETYYGIPAIKSSHYGWLTAAAFFSEGIGGAAQYIATIADIFGDEEDRPLVRSGRYMALAASVVTPILFVTDLHVPKRWYNMLRIFRLTSAMSIGTWSLGNFGIFSTLTATGQVLEDIGFTRVGRTIGKAFQLPASITGAISSSYMGTELEETSTPLWANNFPHLASLFASANASAAGAVLSVAAHAQGLPEERVSRLRRLSDVTGAFAFILVRQIEKDGSHMLRPKSRGSVNIKRRVMRLGLLGLGLATIAGLIRRKSFVPLTAKSIVPRLAAAVLARGILVREGNASARQPEVYFTYAQPDTASSEQQEQVCSAAKNQRRVLIWGIALLTFGIAGTFLRKRKKR